MRTIDRYSFDNLTGHFRKIHVNGDYWLISCASKSGRSGYTKLCLRNALMYLLSFVFIPVKVVD